MDIKTILWYGVLGSITTAYLVAMAGVRSAQHRDVVHHSRRMIIACTIVGIWLVAYVTKQVLFGRERFGGTTEQYWSLYVPIFSVHMSLAVTTIALGGYNLYTGLTRLRQGIGVGAMVSGVSQHRRMGKILLWSFSGTMVTAYWVYLMLFAWYPAS
jgi:uncharacterized membrane protein YozB (DUF420 family)